MKDESTNWWFFDKNGTIRLDRIAACAQVLLDQDRAEEIPHMLEKPWHYGDEFADAQFRED